MKKFLSPLVLIILLQPATHLMAQKQPGKMDDNVRAAQIKELKFGMFVCWSFNTFSGMEWTPTLDKNASYFKATGCDTDQWCKVARDAGMNYILFLTKHHDGFCLWDTQTTDKKVTNSPLATDVLEQLRKSCDKYGLKLALYFSEGDWNWPGAVDGESWRSGEGKNPEMKKAQLQELCTKYGPIEFFWMDHAVGDGGLSHKETVEWIHQFQPNCFVGFNHGEPAGRLSLREMGTAGPIGDTSTTKYNKEAEAGYKGYLAAEFTYPILPPHEGGAMWFYSLPKHDNLCKPAEDLYRDYLGAVKHGNIFSIDVGPDHEGKIRQIDAKTLRQVGKYIRGQQETNSYISTGHARETYADRLGDKLFYIFPETRENPIKWFDSLKVSWLENDLPMDPFIIDAQPGEYLVYQVGTWALKNTLEDLEVRLSDLAGNNGVTIASEQMTCFNKGGITGNGMPFSKRVVVPHDRIQALWMGIDLANVKEGTYEGSVSIVADGMMQTIPLELEVRGDRVRNHGFDEGRRLSRMAWLNSTIGIDSNITQGFEPIMQEGNKLIILGRSLDIAPNGLPAMVTSFFEPSNEFLQAEGEQLIKHPFRFIIELENGEIIHLKPGKIKFTSQSPSGISWMVRNSSHECELICSGEMEYDGFADFKLTLKSKKSFRVKDIRLEISMNKEKFKYMMGLNHEGGLRPPAWEWKWDTTKNQDMLWIGDVNGGLRIKWKAENYRRPLINVYYSFGPLHLPPSWGNGGKGGVNIDEEEETVLVSAFSGQRELKAGEGLHYDFELLITPFKTINKDIKYGDRYYHGGEARGASGKLAAAEKNGANILNIHHAEDIYPFINYPYLDENSEELRQLVKDAHERGIRLKLYYTTRELTKNLPEFWAFNSLQGELIYPGPGNECRTIINKNGPAEWLKNNLRENYIPAWHNIIKEGKFTGELDLSVITTPDSRLNNFYIGGLNWMVRNFKIDGVYIDDSALDRITLRRARKIIDQYRPEGRMDLHSWNHFNQWAGYANCLNLYMDLLPYFDLVWIGEGRDYDRMPDHWLIEVSGIPFGLPGQMLQDGGNPWRGMVYGITSRAGWSGDPTEIWKFWDQYHIGDKKMIGYWDEGEGKPVKSDNDLVKTTFYKGLDEHIIAVANWSEKDQLCSLDIDWNKLGYEKSACKYIIPAIPGFQDKQSPVSLNELIIPGKKGFLILLRKN